MDFNQGFVRRDVRGQDVVDDLQELIVPFLRKFPRCIPNFAGKFASCLVLLTCATSGLFVQKLRKLVFTKSVPCTTVTVFWLIA